MIGFTVTDADREANFFTKVLRFEKVADFRVVGSEYGKMEGVFNANMRIVHLKLGDQIVELTQYVSPPTGRPIPVPSYSNDEWFEHMAIVVNDMDAAYKILQENNVQQISAFPITIPQTNPGPPVSRRSNSSIQNVMIWNCFTSQRAKATPPGRSRQTSCFSDLAIRQ